MLSVEIIDTLDQCHNPTKTTTEINHIACLMALHVYYKLYIYSTAEFPSITYGAATLYLYLLQLQRIVFTAQDACFKNAGNTCN